jgi:hypothetical protein
MRLSSAALVVAAVCVGDSLATVIKRSPYVYANNLALLSANSRRDTNEALVGGNLYVPAVSASPAVPSSTPTPSAAPAAASTASTSSNVVSAASVSTSSLLSLGFKALGLNAAANNGQCWLGSDGPNVNTLVNSASSSIIAVVWGAAGSWMTGATPPLITVALAPGQSQAVSCADVSGGIAAIYPGTTLTAYGQVQNTWAEFTWGAYGTFDVSREVYMNGNSMSIVGSSCTANMNTCVFTCISGTTCFEAGTYKLNNCSPANGGGSDAAAMNGGCTVGSNAKVTTTFG